MAEVSTVHVDREGRRPPVSRFEATAAQAISEEQRRRRQRRIENIKAAVEGKKEKYERDYLLRKQRYELADKHIESLEEEDREEALQNFHAHENLLVRRLRKRWTTADVEAVRVIGKGGGGTVHLVRRAGTGEPMALKRMSKHMYRSKNLRTRLFAEREVLKEAQTRWIVDLYATFQDAENVYMLMEFVPGGDLMHHLLARTTSTEDRARFTLQEVTFYTAELLEALDTVHKSGFIHRDVKLDNIVLTFEGHLKLLDFGLCEPIADNAVQDRRSDFCGTPIFMAPECFREAKFTTGSDLWALGIVAFYLVYGRPPFHAGEMEGREAIRRIAEMVCRHHEECLDENLRRAIDKGYITREADRFFRKVICPLNRRASAEDLRREAFFDGLDFSALHRMEATIRPQLMGLDDSSIFPNMGEEPLPAPYRGPNMDPEFEWSNYEFDRKLYDMQKPETVTELLCVVARSTE